MNYSSELIRGIPNSNFMEGGYPNATLFNKFDENPQRTDDYDELSINWGDDEDALKLIFEQKKESGEYQFKIGGAILKKEELDRLCKKPQVKGTLAYERRKIAGNEYHGNLLLKKGTSKNKKNMVASFLALCVESVELREELID